ncbi:hypothetical protein [Patulibacter sp.]|uniref:hypothetical protein n=1 Tax=Patulibacter sp. TaxID=1912859 RepID=UPI002728F29B|nr:hypothetical protein [Patulibacter sp.]MDO9408726.1 hypothetical protein [Patulibacter sp.]
MISSRRRLTVAATTGVLAVSVAGVALADGRCGAVNCRSDISVSGFAEPQPVKIGETSRLKFTVRNNGPDGTESTELKTTIPDGLKISRTLTYGGPQCGQTGQFVECKLGAFAAFQTMTVQVDVVGTRAQTFQIPANVYGYGSDDPNGGNGQVTASLGVLTKSGSAGSGSGSSNAGGKLTVADPQRPLKTGGVKVRVLTYATGTMRIRGRVYIGRGHVDLSKVVQGVRSGETKDVFLGTTPSVLKKIRAGLRGGKRLRTKISGSVGSRKMSTEIHLRR